MKINFRVKYSTAFGQSIYVIGDHPILGNSKMDQAQPLNFINLEQWGNQVEIHVKSKKLIEYQYVVKDDRSGIILKEWKKRTFTIDPSSTIKKIDLFDTWSSAGTVDYSFETSMFDTFLPTYKKQRLTQTKFTHQFDIHVPLLKVNETIALIGSCDPLGNWDIKNCIPMKRINKNRFIVQVDLSKVKHPFEYKYGIYNTHKKQFIQYEEGENRHVFPVEENHIFYIHDEYFNRSQEEYWKGAGVAIPVFSLRSKKSMGVGEFLDLKQLADWGKETGMRLLQILPVNDTTAQHNWIDSYPYAAVSVFAMHPQYLNIQALPYDMPKTFQTKVQQKVDKLNESFTVPYEKMMQSKWSFIQEIFQKHAKTFLKDQSFLNFFKKNEHWLVSYAAFCVLRDENGTPDFSKWKTLTKYSKKTVHQFAKDNVKVQIHYFVQYYLHQQLTEAVTYLHKKGLVLKGDIPIGIYRYSCDAWVEPQLYNMNMQAGAPPDDFAIKGQNWGFPTYNWDKMEANNFRWWKNRFTQLAQYFDSFRIDHILGFFRIWQIPLHAVEGILGFFEPALPFSKKELISPIDFDEKRFCTPFINETILSNLFGKNKSFVKETFLNYTKGTYALKSKFDTQRKVETFFKENPDEKNIQQALYDLIANVLFIKDSKGYHPRYGLMNTTSFQFLKATQKEPLKNLYHDYFYHRHETFWEEKGFRKLPAIKNATNMLICGEDLGMVPSCVPKVMKELGILSLEVQRMPKNPNMRFFTPESAPYLSVVSPSSHDTSTLRGWWEENEEQTEDFFRTILKESQKAPKIMSGKIVEKVIMQHFYSNAMLAIFPIQDYLGIDEKLRHPKVEEERINIPAIIPHFWNYRLHINLEDLIKEKAFNQKLHQLVQSSGR
ncbi:MAG: 4-alpha-glucanotransferase [Flavobacteriales bacterium]